MNISAKPAAKATTLLKATPETVHWGYLDATIPPALTISSGERVRIERLEAAVGDAVAFEEVLLVGEGAKVKVGAPLVSGGKVDAKVVSQGRDDKIIIIKFRRRKHYKRVQGHRQAFTEVEITGISGA